MNRTNLEIEFWVWHLLAKTGANLIYTEENKKLEPVSRLSIQQDWIFRKET